jgi:hypothetical protein
LAVKVLVVVEQLPVVEVLLLLAGWLLDQMVLLVIPELDGSL